MESQKLVDWILEKAPSQQFKRRKMKRPENDQQLTRSSLMGTEPSGTHRPNLYFLGIRIPMFRLTNKLCLGKLIFSRETGAAFGAERISRLSLGCLLLKIMNF
jgi:hypothetical protein